MRWKFYARATLQSDVPCLNRFTSFKTVVALCLWNMVEKCCCDSLITDKPSRAQMLNPEISVSKHLKTLSLTVWGSCMMISKNSISIFFSFIKMRIIKKHKDNLLIYYRPQRVGKVMFLHVSVILFTGGVPALGGYACSGGCLLQRGLLWEGACSQGVPAPGGLLPGVPAPGGGGAWRPPRSRWLLLRTVHILLECILVFIVFCSWIYFFTHPCV